jgi:uncharacterized membrane protein YqhA
MSAFISMILAKSRFLVLLAVIGSMLGMIALFSYGLYDLLNVLYKSFARINDEKLAKDLTFAVIEVIDIFLLGTVCYITALGLYELFIDDTLDLPQWLQINNLDDLKNKLTSVIIVVMGVSFLSQVISWDGKRDLMLIGFPLAAVIAALTWFLQFSTKNSSEKAKK